MVSRRIVMIRKRRSKALFVNLIINNDIKMTVCVCGGSSNGFCPRLEH